MSGKRNTSENFIHHRSDHGNWQWTGILFIILGVFLLLQNSGYIGELDNWWALFIILPGIATLGGALKSWHEKGEITRKFIDRFASGVTILFVGCILMLEWPWSKVWPVFLIIYGAEFLLKDRIDK